MGRRSETYEVVLTARDELTRILGQIGPTTIKAGRQASRALRGVGSVLAGVQKAARATFGTIGRGLRGLGRAVGRALRPGIASITLFLATFAGISKATTDALRFSEAMSEVSTIVDTSAVSMEGLAQATLDQARAFGTSELDQARALYQSISAGITDTAEATEFLNTATGLAVAGLATTSSTVNVLTNILNAYNLEASEAARVSDVLFATVRAGKTTISELAAGLSVAIPQAANLGVTVEELGAIIATITAGGGGSTAEAATQVASVLRQLQVRFDEVQKALARTGVEFDLNTVRARGLVPVLQDIRDAAGSDERILDILGSRAEALNAVLNTTGRNLGRFESILRQTTNSAGEAGEALDKRLADPAVYVQRLLEERPEVKGIAVPGMPIGVAGDGRAESEGLRRVIFRRDGPHDGLCARHAVVVLSDSA